MPQYLPLPDGSYLKLQEGESPSAGLRRAQQKYPEAFAPAKPAAAGPQSGGLAALKAGWEELGGAKSAFMGKVGLKDMAKAEAEYQAAQKRSKEIFKPTEEGWTEAPLTKVGELFGGSLPYMAAPLAAGAAAAALPLTGIAGTAAALGAAGLTSAGQFTMTNLARQMEGEAGSVPKRSLEQTDLSSAALAAIPQALLDTAAMRMIPGIGRLFGQAGVKVTAANAKEIAEQALTKTLKDYAVKTGKAAGTEGLTEAAQQTFERLQAGLNITDEKARAEYFDSFVGGAVMGGLLSPAGRYVERSGEQRQARGLLEEESQKERKAAADAEEARKKDPTYVLEVAQEYETLNKQKADLQAQIAKGTKEAPLTQEDKDRNTILQQQIAALEPTLKDARKKYIGLGGPDAVKKARESTLELTPPPGRVSEPPAVTEVPGEEETPEAKFARAEQESQGLATLLERQREQIAAATTPEEMVTLAQRAQKTEAALADAQKILAARPQQPDIANIEAELAKARESGDTANVIKYAQQLIAARAAAPAAESGLFAPEAIAAEDVRRQQLSEELAMYAAWEEDARKAAAVEEARRNRTPAQLDLLAEGEAEREGMQERAQTLATQQRQRENAEFRTSQQTTLLPESQQRVERTEGGDRAILGRSVRERIAALEQERRELLNLQETGPTPESATLWGPLSAPSAARKRVQAIDQELTRIQKATQREGVTTTTTGMPMPLDQAQIDTRPQPKLQEQVTTLLERVGTDPKTDTETQDLAARVQEQLPAVLRQLQIQSQEEAQQTRARLAGTSAAGRPVQMSAQLDPLPMVYEWAQSVRSGTPAPDLTRKLTTALQTLEQGQRSETEQGTQQAERGTTPLERSEMIGTSTEGRTTTPTRTPTGEIARASQMDLEMPEPTATSFGSFSEFAKYLASDGLAKLRRSIGLVGPTVSRIERFMQPVQQRAQRLRAYEAQLEQLQKSMRDASAEQRAAAEQKVRAAEYRVAIARSFMESTVDKAIAAKTLAQQKYSDALTQGVDLALQIQENYRAFAQRQADAETRELKDPFGPVAVRVGAIPARQQVADARKNFERWMDAWVRAEEHKRAVVQKHVGGDWSEGSVADREYADAKKTLDAARKDLQHARLRLSAAEKKYRAADATAATPISDNEVNEYFAKEAQLQEALKKQRRRITALGNLAKINKDSALETYVREREAEAIALQQRLKNATPSTNIGAIIGASNDRLQQLYNNITAKGEYLISIDGQFDAFEAALKDLALAQEMQLEVVRETAPPAVRAQAVQAVATAQRTNAATAAATLERLLRSLRGAAQQRAEQRRAPPVVAEETQSEREARDGETRKAEQARLERGERPVAGPATEAAGVYAEKGLGVPQAEGTPTARQQISFKGGIRYQAKDDQVYVALVERSTSPKLTSAQRIVVSEEADAYLAKKEAERAALEAGRPAAVAKKEGDVASAEMRIANNEAKLAEVRLSKAAEKKHQNDPATREALLEVKREKLRAEIKVDQDKLANHRRLLNEKLGYPEVTRTDPAEVRKYREKLAAEIQRSFEPGKRLGVEEGTRQRAIGPVTRDEVMPPRTMRTGTDESRTGVTTTGTSQPLQEVRGVKQRDVAMKPAEMAAANEAAAAMRTVDVVDKERRDLIAKSEAAKERGYAEGEQERFVEQLAILDRRKETLKADEAALAEKKQTATASIAANRSRINEINAQLKFIEDNPGQTPDAVNKQRTKNSELKTEREKLASELRELYKTQTAVEAEAKKNAAAETAATARKTAPKKKAAPVEPTVTRAKPPKDPKASWSPTVTLDYGTYTIENDADTVVYELKGTVELSPAAPGAKLKGLVLSPRGVTVITENAKGREVLIRVNDAYIRLENPGSFSLRDFAFGNKPDESLLKAFGSDLIAKLDAAKPEARVDMVMEAITKRAGLDNLKRFNKEYAAMRAGTAPKKTRGRKAKVVEEEAVNEEEDLDTFVPEILDGEREDVFLSRGATENPSTTADVRAELGKVFPDLGRVQIFDSVEALVAANPEYEGRIPDDARGFVDPDTNKAFLIAENIEQGQALGVLLHEVGAHIGLKNMLGTAQYNALVKAVGAWAKKNDGSVESRVAKAAQERVEAAQTPANQKDDELLAYAIEEAVNAGVKPMETKGVLGQWLSQIAQMFRKALQKFGLPPKALDAQGLVDMAFGAAKMEMRGTGKPTPPTPNKKRSDDLMFTYAGERSGIASEELREAKEMTAQGKPMEEVWSKTGWFQSADKKWRFEIDDSQAKFNYDDYYEALKDGAVDAKGRVELKLSNILWHPKLYKAYPALKDLPVKLYEEPDSGLLGSFGKDGIELNLASNANADSEGVLLHEVQHYIQAQEGFVRGSNTTVEHLRAYARKVLTSVRESYARMSDSSNDFDRRYYGVRVVALDAGIAAANKKRKERAEDLVAATKEYRAVRAEVAAAIEKLDAEYNSQTQVRSAAFDRLMRAKTRAEQSEAQAQYKSLPSPNLTAHFDAKDVLREKQRIAHRKFLEVKYSRRNNVDDAVTAAIKAALPKDPTFAEFAKVFIAEQAYENNLGEIEARDVEERRKLTPEERATTRPYSSQPQRREEILFSRNVPTAARVANALVGKEKGWVDYLRDNFLGMGSRAQFVDKLAPVEEALKKGGVSTIKALQAMYFLRMYDQRMHVTSEAMTEGVSEVVEKARKDGGTERIIQTKPGANIKKVVDILKQKAVIKAAGGADAVNNMFTLYLAAIRAERVGYDTLNFGRPWAIAEIQRIETELKSTQLSQETRSNLQKKRSSLEKRLDTMPTEADFKAARAEIEADPVLKKAFDEARDIYNQYNRNLLEFSVQTGALSRDVANKLLAQNDYIPYYRIRDGVAQMVIGGETPIRIGNLKDSPHLKELVKGDEAIFDFLTSSVQNTAMLLDMAMKNLATKNAMFELRDVGLATISKVPKSGKTPEGAVTFKRDGEDYFAIVDTDAIGIDSDLLVKGMAGIPTMFPAIVRLMGMPARVLRRVVVASPVYMARQLFRDSLAASMTSGANITPVLGALRQIGKADVLRGRGITGGQVFTGMPEDVTRMLKEMQAGRVGVSSGLAWLEAKSAQADALTRRAQYQSYLDQGLSEMEATFMALESMNFSKRGLSPTMHMASTLIPFFNAQIQGLDVLYKAFTGKMPMNERLAIREKLLVRGSLMFGMSIAYAMAMQDEEDYKNARPEEKYGNWLVRVPGFDEMVRLPIPFELGYVFKALPEALVNIMLNEKGGEEAAKAAKHFATQMVPGLSNYYLPQAVKPGLEVLLNKSIYTGRDIESTKEQMVEPGQRYRDNTTAAAREIGEFLNISPIKMEYLIRGYTGSMGMALLAAVSAPFGSAEGPQAATKRMSDMPVIGTMFQPKDASGIIDATFARMKEVRMVKETYDDMIEKGRIADAQKYLSTRTNEMALSSVEGSFREYMGQIAEYERGIKASSMTPDEKREKLDAAKQMKIRLATAVRAVADKKEPQAALD